jgi:hypothetical protein
MAGSLAPLMYWAVDENGGVLDPPFPVVHNHLLYHEGDLVVLAPHGQVSDLLPIGCFIIVGDQSFSYIVSIIKLPYCV